jgi:hypothetical protein
MVGAGAIAGTLAGGHGNARSPIEVDDAPAIVAQPVARASILPAVPAVTAEGGSPEASPATVVATRFPGDWHGTTQAGPAAAASPVMAYAAESRRSAPAPQAEAEPSFQLASADTNPPMPKRMVRPAQPKSAVLFNDAQLASIHSRLRLTRDQEQYWPQVEQALRAISWRLATQQDSRRPVRGSQAQMIDPNSPEVQRLKSAAIPLIMSMREDQKQQVRQLAHTMGLTQVASMF